MKTWMCLICGYVYSEEQGDPDHGLAPGTLWGRCAFILALPGLWSW